MRKSNHNIVLLLLFLSLTAVFLISRHFLLKPQDKLQLVRIVPGLNQSNVALNTEIKFSFNQNIEAKNFSVVSSPDFDYQIASPKSPQDLILQPREELKPNQKYQIEIKNEAKDFFFDFAFFTTMSAAPSLSISPSPSAGASGKGNPAAYQELVEDKSTDYPLLYQTPKETEYWIAAYLETKKLIVIYRSTITLSQTKEEVFAWMEEEGVDPQSHQFVWKIKTD